MALTSEDCTIGRLNLPQRTQVGLEPWALKEGFSPQGPVFSFLPALPSIFLVREERKGTASRKEDSSLWLQMWTESSEFPLLGE